jgi:hypothetical protein
MYIRWQSRKLKRTRWGRSTGSDTSWSVIVVESRRIDGKPTKQHVAYLGSYVESGGSLVTRRIEFWDAVAERLQQLNNRISADDRKKIEAAIALKVRQPTPEERRIAKQRSAEILARRRSPRKPA